MEMKVSKEDMATLPYIIAVDFDGTLVTDEFPEIGQPIKYTWDRLWQAKSAGAKIILWTSRDNEHLQKAIDFCALRGFEFDAVNDNLPECKKMFSNDTRKVYANEYWDDKAISKFCDRLFPYGE